MSNKDPMPFAQTHLTHELTNSSLQQLIKFLSEWNSSSLIHNMQLLTEVRLSTLGRSCVGRERHEGLEGPCCLGAAQVLGEETVRWGRDFGAASTQCPGKVSGPVHHPLPLTVCPPSASLPQPLLLSLLPCWALGLLSAPPAPGECTDQSLSRVCPY